MDFDHLQSYSEEAFRQEASPADPNEPFAYPCYSSNASHVWPSSDSTSFSRMKHETHSPEAHWDADAMRMDLAAELVHTDGLRWPQYKDSACSSDVYPGQTGLSAFDARDDASKSSRALAIGDAFDPLLGLREYDQFAYVPGYYNAPIDHTPFSTPCSVSSMPLDDYQSYYSSVYPLAHGHNPVPNAFAEPLPWSRSHDSTQLLVDAGSHLCLDLEDSSHKLPTQYDMDLDSCWSDNGAAIDLDSISNVTNEPEIENLDDSISRLSCYHDGCRIQFKNVADRKRHLNTIHNEAGQSFMCAHLGCVRAYKVWNRLDSFRKHAKLHNPKDMDALVEKSRKKGDGLRVAVTTQAKLRRCRPGELDSRLSKSHDYYCS